MWRSLRRRTSDCAQGTSELDQPGRSPGSVPRAVWIVAAVSALLAMIPNGPIDQMSAEASPAMAWTPVAGEMSVGRTHHRAVALDDGRVLVVGGADAANLATTVTEIYDPSTETWAPGPPLTLPRGSLSATRLGNGQVLIAGGFPHGWVSELFDPVTNTLSRTGALNTSHDRHGSALLDDGRVLVAGGYQGCMIRAAEIFDPITSTWTYVQPMQRARADFSLVRLPDGRLLAAGGVSDCTVPKVLSAVEVFDPTSGTWSNAAPMNVPRGHYMAALLPDGRVIVAGGDNATGILSSVEIYDPEADVWTLVTSMHSARYSPIGDGLFVMENGKVLVAGGDQTLLQGTSEIYDPSIDEWSELAFMNENRCSSATTTLTDGRHLVVSGSVCGATTRITSSEYFESDSIDPFLVPTSGVLTQGWSWSSHCLRDGQAGCHSGVDIAGPRGTEVVAIANGDVIRTNCEPGGFGWYVVLDHGAREDGQHLYSLYAHLGEADTRAKDTCNMGNPVTVHEGDRVVAGDLLGVQGNSGRVSGPTGVHLHFTMMMGSSYPGLAGAIDASECVGLGPYLAGEPVSLEECPWSIR